MTGIVSFSRSKIMAVLALMFVVGSVALAEECKLASEMDAGTKSAMESAAQRYYQAAVGGNFADLQQNAIPALASDFSGIQATITDQRPNLGTSGTIRGTYELDAPGAAPLARAEFYCGIMNSANYVAFAIPNLPPGNYGLVIMDSQGGKSPVAVSFVLQQVGSQWKIGGMYIRPTAIAGHDSQWFWQQAQQYHNAGKQHAAWFYYLTAWDLAAPVRFIGTKQLDTMANEIQRVRPGDLVSPQQTLELPSGGKVYRLTDLFAIPVSDGLGLVVKYQVPDVSNTNVAYADNMAVMSGLLQKYPEFREAFSSIVARAVAPNGQDYGTLLAMKNIK